MNAVVSHELFDAFRAHCDAHGLVRDRTAERALEQFLRTEASQDQEFVVSLSDETAHDFREYRLRHRLPDRSLLVEDAIQLLIAADVIDDPELRHYFKALLEQRRLKNDGDSRRRADE